MGQRAKPVIIGVAGGSGSGKTTVVRRVVQKLGADRVTCIQHDSYYHDRGSLPLPARTTLNYDHPDALDTRLLIKHLNQLVTGHSASIPIYDFASHVRMSDSAEVKPKQAIIVEGILVLVDRDLRELMDIKVFVDTDADLRLIRRLERDLKSRQRTLDSVMRQYRETVRPMHLRFVEPSKRHADFFIAEGGFNDVAVDMLANRILALINGPEPEKPLK